MFARKAGLGIKTPASDFIGDFANFRHRLIQALRRTDRGDGLIVRQVVEGQPHRVQAEFTFCRQRIDRELQTLVGVLLRARPSGLVVDQLHWTLWERGRSLRFPTPDSRLPTPAKSGRDTRAPRERTDLVNPPLERHVAEIEREV